MLRDNNGLIAGESFDLGIGPVQPNHLDIDGATVSIKIEVGQDSEYHPAPPGY